MPRSLGLVACELSWKHLGVGPDILDAVVNIWYVGSRQMARLQNELPLLLDKVLDFIWSDTLSDLVRKLRDVVSCFLHMGQLVLNFEFDPLLDSVNILSARVVENAVVVKGISWCLPIIRFLIFLLAILTLFPLGRLSPRRIHFFEVRVNI